MTANDHGVRADRATRLEILTAADYKCQLEYSGCSITATELAQAGELNGTPILKASCKECRRQRDTTRQIGNRLAANRLRRARG